MIVAIVGSRTYPHPERVTEYVAQLDVDDEVVSGDGGIVDQTAHQAALTRRLVAFWDERSRGTGDAVDRAHTKGIPVEIIRP